MYFRSALVIFAVSFVLAAQEQAPSPPAAAPAPRSEAANPDQFVVTRERAFR